MAPAAAAAATPSKVKAAQVAKAVAALAQHIEKLKSEVGLCKLNPVAH
jgi:hypothetical protein